MTISIKRTLIKIKINIEQYKRLELLKLKSINVKIKTDKNVKVKS